MSAELISIKKIKPNPKNPRFIKDYKYKELLESLRTSFWMMEARPIVVDENMVVLGGNQRLRACQELKYKEAWVQDGSKWTQKQQDEFIIKDNTHYGEWDFDMLANEWEQKDLQVWGLDGFPFEEEVLEAEEDDYTEPDNIKVDVILGDLIEIGEHRLLCGDSTDSDQVLKLMNGEVCNLVTDPPYGINANKQTLGTGKKEFYRGKDWDVKVPDFYYIVELVNKSIIWGGNYFADKLKVNNDWLCWHKKNDGLSFSEFELAWSNIGKNTRILSHHWGGETKQHPTMKPVKVIEWCINLLDDKKPILDIFLGSGSTMVAAHQLKRKCYGMELDPKYCQVIIDRMIKLDKTLHIKINGKEYKQIQ